MDDRVLWGVVAAVLAALELVTLDLTAAMLAVGALGGLAAASLGAPLLGSAAVAVLTSALLLVVARPVAKRHLEVRGRPNDPGQALEGVTAVVVQEVSDDAGQVRVHGELWTARPALPGQVLPAGASVWIGAVTGATLSVHPLGPSEAQELP